MAQNDVRLAILSRRARFVAAALAGAGLAVGACAKDESKATACLSPAFDAGHGGQGGPQACLSPAAGYGGTGGVGGAQVCLSAAGGGGQGGAGGPQPCLEPPVDGGG
ncbi:MAG: hypothetical protein HY744_27695 [Deltaproteobacteria bacterium]|nr:hypothetical protein [Deltaproteobacteria bacterium]